MSCEIVIDTPGPYYSGSLIQGKLICTFNSNQKIRGIKIRAYGDEHTEWWGTESYYNHTEKRHETRSVLYTGDNSLFSLESMLYGGNSGDIHVGPGRFTYPFSFQLPPNLPSSFDNNYGHIRYTLKGIVDIPWGMDYEDKIHFVMLSLIDLNNFPLESFQPVSRSDEKTICCWCCSSGDITVDINLSKSAFVPGENIKLYVALTNMSNSNVDGLEAKLVQYIRSHVHHPSSESKVEEVTLASDNWSGVGAHGENKYDIELRIPNEISVPNLDRSSLFEVSYDIEISASIPGCHSDIDLSFSVNLGHIQHQSQMNGPPPPGGYGPPPTAGYSPPPPGGYGPPPTGGYGPPPAGGYGPPPSFPNPQEGNGYPYQNNGSTGGGYPYPGGNAPPPGGAPIPQAPFPSAQGVSYPPGAPVSYPSPAYPPAGPGFTSPGATAPTAPAPYSNGPPNYSAVSTGGPWEKSAYPSGPPSAPGGASPMHSKELEALGGAESGTPSAPPSEPPPPSYADITKKN